MLIWPWGTVGVLYCCCFWGIMRNFRPWRWTIVGPLQCFRLKKDGSLNGLRHSESESLGGGERKETRKKYGSTISCTWGELSTA